MSMTDLSFCSAGRIRPTKSSRSIGSHCSSDSAGCMVLLSVNSLIALPTYHQRSLHPNKNPAAPLAQESERMVSKGSEKGSGAEAARRSFASPSPGEAGPGGAGEAPLGRPTAFCARGGTDRDGTAPPATDLALGAGLLTPPLHPTGG